MLNVFSFTMVEFSGERENFMTLFQELPSHHKLSLFWFPWRNPHLMRMKMHFSWHIIRSQLFISVIGASITLSTVIYPHFCSHNSFPPLKHRYHICPTLAFSRLKCWHATTTFQISPPLEISLPRLTKVNRKSNKLYESLLRLISVSFCQFSVVLVLVANGSLIVLFLFDDIINIDWP